MPPRGGLVRPYYEHSGITIYHGDCREILPHLPKADLVLTDPPYGISFPARPTKWQRLAGEAAQHWDGAPVEFLADVLARGAHSVIWGGNYYPLPPSRGWLCWHKPDAPPSMSNLELAWTSRNANARLFTWSISATNGERVKHPTQKPVALMRWCLAQFAEAGSILDPFMGSGSTLVAARALGLTATGIEIQERYCEMAAGRLQQEAFDFGPVAPGPEQLSLLEAL